MAVVEIRHGFPDGFANDYDAIPREYGRDEWDRWRPPHYTHERSGMPHCDDRVLHAPGECAVCDLYPDRQTARVKTGVAFTGHRPRPGESACPADLARPKGMSNWHGRWGGNVPPRAAEPLPSWAGEQDEATVGQRTETGGSLPRKVARLVLLVVRRAAHRYDRNP